MKKINKTYLSSLILLAAGLSTQSAMAESMCEQIQAYSPSTELTDITVKNNSSEVLQIRYLNSSGELDATIYDDEFMPGEKWYPTSYIGDKWVMTDLNGNCKQVLTTVENGAYSIGEPEIDENTVITLHDSAPKQAVRLHTGGKSYYSLTVSGENNQATFQLKNSLGTASLLVKKGALPSEEDYDCITHFTDGTATCSVTSGAGEYYAMTRAHDRLWDGTITATARNTINIIGTGGGHFTPAVYPETPAYFRVDVPLNATSTQVSVQGGQSQGHSTLLVKSGALPTENDFDCRTTLSNLATECSISGGGEVFIAFTTEQFFSSTIITVNYQGGEIEELSNGETANIANLPANQARYYKLTTNYTADLAVFAATASDLGTLYVSQHQLPTLDNYDCKANFSGYYNGCTLTEGRGTYYAMLISDNVLENIELTAYYGQLDKALTLEQYEHIPYLPAGEQLNYTLEVTEDSLDALFMLKTFAGESSLYINKGSRASEQDYDCIISNSGFDKQFCPLNLSAGKYYLSLVAETTLDDAYIGAYIDQSGTTEPEVDPSCQLVGQAYNRGGYATFITFKNLTDSSLKIKWLRADGSIYPYEYHSNLTSGYMWSQYTYTGDRWLITDQNDQCVKVISADAWGYYDIGSGN